MRNRKSLLCYFIFMVSYLFLVFLARPVSLDTFLGAAAGFALCAEVANGVLFKKEFNFGWIIVANNGNHIERGFCVLAGFVFLILSIFALFGDWGF